MDKRSSLSKAPTIASLLEKVEALSLEIGRLNKRVKKLEGVEQENVKLRKENTELREKVTKFENPKHSRNSSVPPSKDENRPLRTKSLREQTGKKPGGQPGHEGNTLKMSVTPDKIEEHVPHYCNCCGADISHLPCEYAGKRQVLDIPPVKPEYTEHRVYQTKCCCGHVTKSDFPVGVNTAVSYGHNVESLIGYFHVRQYLPFDRMKEVFHDVFTLPVSEGGLHHILSRLSKKALPAYELIRQKIAGSHVVGTDETGVKINGKNHWYWTWQNENATFIAPSENRGYKTIEENFKDGFPNSTMVHDCWKSHFQPEAQSHQLCLAHLFRELNYFIETDNAAWAGQFKELLKKAIGIEKQMSHEHYYRPYQPRSDIKESLDKLLLQTIHEKHKRLASFKKRMNKYKNFLLTFMYHPKVPSDNNGSERAIRNVKVKQKISGQFKNIAGAKQFAILRSVTDTAIKNSQNVLNALFVIANCEVTD